ncbi:hypothetical protein ALC152_05170 [Arcobacter sp. 15-2]|uniref:hypothetical protein n=1 Tax=Arcobacter sp. 15-2 TaxID=3374109 RepID=UPI00399D35B8
MIKIKDIKVCEYTSLSQQSLSRIKKEETQGKHKRYSLLKRAVCLEMLEITDDDLLLLVDLKNRFNKEQ